MIRDVLKPTIKSVEKWVSEAVANVDMMEWLLALATLPGPSEQEPAHDNSECKEGMHAWAWTHYGLNTNNDAYCVLCGQEANLVPLATPTPEQGDEE